MEAHFSFNDLCISVSSAGPADLEWLEENLCPAFEKQSRSGNGFHIHCTFDAARFDNLRGDTEVRSAQPAAIFSLDGCAATYPTWISGDQCKCVLDTHLECIYVFDRTSDTISVVSKRWRPAIRIALFRVMREIASQRGLENGALHQHAAAASINGSGVLICGPKRAGKTTLLSQLLQAGAHYIANDRSVIRLDGREAPILSGMPTIVSVRENTMSLIDAFLPAHTGGWFARHTLGESLLDDRTAQAETEITALSISPAQYCHLLGQSQQAHAMLKCLLFPRVDTSVAGIEVSELKPIEAEQRLESNAFALSETVFTQVRRSIHAAEAARHVRERVAKACRSYELVLGTGAQDKIDALETLWPAHAVL